MQKREKTIQGIMDSYHTVKRSFNTNHLGIRNKGEITPAQWPIISSLKDRPTIALKELTAMLQISSSAITQLVDALVKKGLIVRKESVDDRRVILIELTKKAKESLAIMREKAVAHLSKAFTVLTDEELAIYDTLSAKVADNIRSQKE
jgi:DNA-binding MarR family transcriptional regulator